MAERRPALLQVDVHAAEGHARDGDALLIRADRGVHGGQKAIVAGGPQRGGRVLSCRQLPQYMFPAPAAR